MRIGFDLRPFLKEETGVGVYFRNLLQQLAVLDRENEYFLFSCSWKDRFPSHLLPPFARRQVLDLRLPVRLLNALWYRLGRPTLDSFFRTRLDLTHSPVPVFLPTRGKKIITICDLFFLEHPELADRQARRNFTQRVGRAVSRADGVVTISEYSRRVIIDRLGAGEAKVRAIPLGLDPGFFEAPPPSRLDEARRKFALPDRFALFVGAFEPRKNLLRLAEAWRLLWDRSLKTPLVLAGRRGADFENVKGVVRRLGLEEAVRIIGYVSRDDLGVLYRLATVFIFPSLCEGFGLPLLEAMASGLPMAASATSAMPEVAGEAALFFDPLRVEDIASAAGRLLEDESLRRDFSRKGIARARRFSWAETARGTLDFYRSLG